MSQSGVCRVGNIVRWGPEQKLWLCVFDDNKTGVMVEVCEWCGEAHALIPTEILEGLK